MNNLKIHLDRIQKEMSNKEPIKRGCNNERCFCTGRCQEVIGYREKNNNINI